MHRWQDIVLAISICVFNIALVPSVFSKSKPALTTSLLTTVFLLATVVAYVSLSLWYTAVMSSINTVLWGTLAVQKLVGSKSKKHARR